MISLETRTIKGRDVQLIGSGTKWHRIEFGEFFERSCGGMRKLNSVKKPGKRKKKYLGIKPDLEVMQYCIQLLFAEDQSSFSLFGMSTAQPSSSTHLRTVVWTVKRFGEMGAPVSNLSYVTYPDNDE